MAQNILLVPNIDLANFPNDLHLQLNQTQDEQMDHEFDPETPAPGKLAQAIADHKAAVEAENRAYLISRSSELTAQIAEQDSIRDTKMGELTAVVDAMAKVASLPAMQQAAQTMQTLWNVYSPNPKAAYETETTALQQWHEDYLASAEQQQAAQTLGVVQIIADMMTANQEVHRLIVERENAHGMQQNLSMSLKDARVETDKAYKWMILCLNAYKVVDQDEHRWEGLSSNLITQQEYYLQLVKNRQRVNKRVSVKSDIVGNHLYATTPGWDWQQLIADGKALLAVDEADETRIVSTDKKAQKAGGLYLALDGVLVKPSDDVDVEKEYQLIPIEG